MILGQFKIKQSQFDDVHVFVNKAGHEIVGQAVFDLIWQEQLS
jgi:hypothetical protein